MLLFELLADLIIAGNKNRFWDQWMFISIIDVIIMFRHWGKPPIEWSDRFSTTAVSIVNHEWMFKNLFFIFDPLIFISSPTCSFFQSNNIFCLFHLEPNRLLDHFPEIDSPSWLIRNSLWKHWSLPNSHQNTQNTHNMSLTHSWYKSLKYT